MGKLNSSSEVIRNEISGDSSMNLTNEENTQKENNGEFEFVLIDMPKCEDCVQDPLNVCNNDTNRISAVFIEVPHSTDENLDLTEFSSYIFSQDLPETIKKEQITVADSTVQSSDTFRTKEVENSVTVQELNGYHTQPLIMVREDKTKQTKTKVIEAIKPGRLLKGNQPKPVKIKKSSEHLQDGDLKWLLNFKLDNILSDFTAGGFEPLDNFPANRANDNDAKKVKESAQNLDGRRKKSWDEENRRNRKPPFTYTELIECALQEKGPLTVSEIYQWISDTFPFYKSWDDRWKNSVRHNLSINPYFRKGTKARQGSGHLWTVSKSAESIKSWSWKKEKYQEFEAYKKRAKLEEEAAIDDAKEAAMAAAIIEDKENRGVHQDVLLSTHAVTNTDASSLLQSAEEILSGVKRNVTVEYIESPKCDQAGDENDFLNPVSKEILMGECGFMSQIELNLTAETAEHCIVETEGVFGLPHDLLFQYSDVNSQTTVN